MTYREEFIHFMVRSWRAHHSGTLPRNPAVRHHYFVNTGNYKTGAQAARLGDYYAACIQENMPQGITALFVQPTRHPPGGDRSCLPIPQLWAGPALLLHRKEAKDHGEGGVMMGYQPQAGDDIAIVEDVVTAGTAVRESIELFKHVADVNIRALFVSVDRMERGTRACSHPGRAAGGLRHRRLPHRHRPGDHRLPPQPGARRQGVY